VPTSPHAVVVGSLLARQVPAEHVLGLSHAVSAEEPQAEPVARFVHPKRFTVA
jgi:hypothetical protein